MVSEANPEVSSSLSSVFAGEEFLFTLFLFSRLLTAQNQEIQDTNRTKIYGKIEKFQSQGFFSYLLVHNILGIHWLCHSNNRERIV